MPFSPGFRLDPSLVRLLRIRHRPVVGHAVALSLVGVAIVSRELIAQYLGPRIPFITFFPAIILATLLGGLRPGLLATAFSAATAWYFYLPPTWSWALEVHSQVQLLLFLVISALNVGMAALLGGLVDCLFVQHRNIELLLDSAPNGFVVVDREGRIQLANKSTATLFGYTSGELAGAEVEMLVPAGRMEGHRQERIAYQADHPVARPVAGRDLRGRRKDGTEFPVEVGLTPLEQSGEPAVLATVVDITARKRLEEHHRMLLDEVEHRSRNLLAVVDVIVSRTLSEASSLEEARAAIAGRLHALAEATTLRNDQGAILLDALIEHETAPYRRQVHVTGCDVAVTPDIAQRFALIFHELTTNAAKYGALSVPGGSVIVAGTVEAIAGEGTFTMTWRELGGPRAVSPARRGFGSLILDHSARQFADRVLVEYPAEGLIYRLFCPLHRIQALPLEAASMQ